MDDTCQYDHLVVVGPDGKRLETSHRDLVTGDFVPQREYGAYAKLEDERATSAEFALRARVLRAVREWPVCAITGEAVRLRIVTDAHDYDPNSTTVHADFHCESCHGAIDEG